VVTFHDLFPLEFPEWYSAAYSKWYSIAMRRLATRAIHLIAVSEYTKSRIVRLLGRDPDDIMVIHNDTSTLGRATPRKIEEARLALNLPSRRYVLCLSSLESRKNLRLTLEAWASIQPLLPKDTLLVVAGPKADEKVYGKQDLMRDLPNLLFTGYVHDDHLAGLYSGASLFVFPSLGEGFGLPLLEAMACGVRCVTSFNSSLPEVGGDVVDYIDPHNPAELAQVMLKRLREDHDPCIPFQPVIDRSREFSWDTAASKTREVLTTAADQDLAKRIASSGVARRRSVVAIGPQSPGSDPQMSPVPHRVALVHDWLTGMRGGEKVLELFCRRWPDAPLWTLLYLPGQVSQTIASRPIHTSLLQRMPFAATKYRNYLPFFPIFAELHKARSADIVISTSHAVAKSMIHRHGRNTPYHICYIHTPMRYAWDLFDEYFGPSRVGWIASRFLFRPLVQLLRLYDAKTVNRVDLFVANSRYVADRVRRLYGRQAEVLPPPVNVERFRNAVREPEDWFLVVSALVPYKRVDQAIRACSAIGRPLKIIGKGPELAVLKTLAAGLKADVEFIGWASDEELTSAYRRARALLFPGIEDFGIVPVEAIACGCPVIALGVGGILDSMTDKTAVLYTEATHHGLIDAIHQFEARKNPFSEEALRARAEYFSESNFLDRFEQKFARVQRQLATSASTFIPASLAVVHAQEAHQKPQLDV
jgi:glycosyltransferase involved in cell wall biosynthesis